MKRKINQNLHNQAYNDFRWYLDTTYTAKGSEPVIGLSVGYPAAGEFPLPNSVLDKLMPYENGREKPRPGYGWEAGSTSLRQSIVAFENLLHNVSYNNDNICMVAGASYGLNRIFEQIFKGKNNSQLLVVAPTFYRMLGRADNYADVVSVVGREENDFQITASELLSSLDNNTKAVFILNPSNPTYIYYPDSFFEEVIPVLKSKGIYLIIDESGDAFYMGEQKERLKKFPSIIESENVIRIVTASKKYLFAEYRIGYVLAGKKFIGNKGKGFIKLIGDDIGNAPLAANEAWEQIIKHEILYLESKKCLERNCDFEIKHNKNNEIIADLRSFAIMRLRKSKKIGKIIVPNTNFNVCFKVTGTKYKNDKELYKALLSETKISILPCSGLGIPSELMYFRLTYGINKRLLNTALDKFLDFIEK
ncbi:MAG: pyridoxal phosphate-dependent aminotransferase [bacterium]